jgi:hypothetical protein
MISLINEVLSAVGAVGFWQFCFQPPQNALAVKNVMAQGFSDLTVRLELFETYHTTWEIRLILTVFVG